MKAGRLFGVTAGYLWRIALCAIAYVVGTMVGGAAVSGLGMDLPSIAEATDERLMGLLSLVGSIVVAAALGPLARRLKGTYLVRVAILAVFTYVCLGVNTLIESSIFTTAGGTGGMIVLLIAPCVLCAVVAALVFKPAQTGQSFLVEAAGFLGRRSRAAWAWRLLAALAAFPVIYLIFGMAISPLVAEHYREQIGGLVLPDMEVIVGVQFVRSSLFLLAALGVLIMWSGSRRGLVLTLGFAFFVMVGLYGLIQGYWLSPLLRIVHSVEILADSFVYAWALVVLLVKPPVLTGGTEAVISSVAPGRPELA
ncbi:MAG: hypothetical protein JSU70_12360 [Phycisphaerales bacterium]|nr:MAG: hypothetical protein JSU70_12360 [Phycisphaerales bacterium]